MNVVLLTGTHNGVFTAMERMISEISCDEELKKTMLGYVSAYTIKRNYKKIGKNPPVWL